MFSQNLDKTNECMLPNLLNFHETPEPIVLGISPAEYRAQCEHPSLTLVEHLQGLFNVVSIAEQLVFLVENLDDVVLDVVSMQEHALVADLPVEREAHGQVVGVLLSVDAALAVAVVLLLLHGVVLGVLMTVSDGHGQSELHALGLALRQ